MTNLIDLIKQQVTPEVLGQLATMTGENKPQIEGAVAAIVPTLVTGALNKSATPAGAQDLLDAIGSLGAPDNFASLLGGGAACTICSSKVAALCPCSLAPMRTRSPMGSALPPRSIAARHRS